MSASAIVSLLLLSIAAPISQVFAEPLFCQSGTCTHNAPTVWGEFPAAEWPDTLAQNHRQITTWPLGSNQVTKLINFPTVVDLSTKETTIFSCGSSCHQVHIFSSQFAVIGPSLEYAFFPTGVAASNVRWSLAKHHDFNCELSDVSNWGMPNTGSYASYKGSALHTQAFGVAVDANSVHTGAYHQSLFWPYGGTGAASSLNVHASYTNGVFLANDMLQTISFVQVQPGVTPVNLQVTRVCGVVHEDAGDTTNGPSPTRNTASVDGLCGLDARFVSLGTIAVDVPGAALYVADAGSSVRKIALDNLQVTSPWQGTTAFDAAQGTVSFAIHDRKLFWTGAATADQLYSLDLASATTPPPASQIVPATTDPVTPPIDGGLTNWVPTDANHILLWYNLVGETEAVQRLTLITRTAPTPPAAPTVDFCNGATCEYDAAHIGDFLGTNWKVYPGRGLPATHAVLDGVKVVKLSDGSSVDYTCTLLHQGGCHHHYFNTGSFVGNHFVFVRGHTHNGVVVNAQWVVAREQLAIDGSVTEGKSYGKIAGAPSPAQDQDYADNAVHNLAFGVSKNAQDVYFGDKEVIDGSAGRIGSPRTATTERWLGNENRVVVIDNRPNARTVYLLTPTFEALGDNSGMQVERFCGVRHDENLEGYDFVDGCCEKTASFRLLFAVAVDETHAWIGDRGVLRRIVLATKTVITTHGWTKVAVSAGAHDISQSSFLPLSLLGNSLVWQTNDNRVFMMDKTKVLTAATMDPAVLPVEITPRTAMPLVQFLGLELADANALLATMQSTPSSNLAFYRLDSTDPALCGLNEVYQPPSGPCVPSPAGCDYNTHWVDRSQSQPTCTERTASCPDTVTHNLVSAAGQANVDNYCQPKCNFHTHYLVGSVCTQRTGVTDASECQAGEHFHYGGATQESACTTCPSGKWWDASVSLCKDPDLCTDKAWHFVKTPHTAVADAVCGHKCCDMYNANVPAGNEKPYTHDTTCAVGATNCCSDLPNHEFPWNTHYYDTTASQCKTRETTATCLATFTDAQDPLVFLHSPTLGDANRPTMATKCGYPTACGCGYDSPQCAFWETKHFVSSTNCPTRTVNGDCSSHQEVLPAAGDLTIANAQADSVCINKCCSEAGLTPSASCDPWGSYWLSSGTCTQRTSSCGAGLVLQETTTPTAGNTCINNCLSTLRSKRCKYGPLPASECVNTGNPWSSTDATCRDIYDAQKASSIDQQCFTDAENAQMNYFLNDVCSQTAPKKECRLTPSPLNNKIPPSGVAGWADGSAGTGTVTLTFDENTDLAATQPAGDQDKPYGYRLLVFPDKRDPIKANLFSTISQMRTNLLGTNPTGEAALIQDMEFTDIFWSSVKGSDSRFTWVSPASSCALTYSRQLTLADDCEVIGAEQDGSPKYACKMNAYNLWPRQLDQGRRQSPGTDKWTISPPQQFVTGPGVPSPGSAQTVSLDIAGGTSSEGSLTIADFSCKMNVDFEVVCRLENAGAADWRVADFSVVANSQFKIETPTNVATTWIQDTIGSRRIEGPENRFSIKTLPVTQTGTYVVQFNIQIAPQANPTALANVLLKVTLLMTGQTNLQYVTAALTQPDADRVYGPHDVLTIDFASPNGDHYVNLQQIYMKNAIGNFIYADRSVAAADDYFKITCNPTGQTATTQQCTFLPGGGANTNPLFYEHPPFVIGADVAIAPTATPAPARRQRQQGGSGKTNPSRDRGYLGQININVSATSSNAAPQQQQRTSSTSSSGFFTARNKILIAAIAGALVVITVAVIVAVVLVRRSIHKNPSSSDAEMSEANSTEKKPGDFTVLGCSEISEAAFQSDSKTANENAHNDNKYLAESDCADSRFSAPDTPRESAEMAQQKVGDENEA